MADTFFGFGTLLSNVNDDEGGGGPSEDEYDALNDETFGNVGDDLDWEEEHEQLAELTEKSRRHKDEDLDLEASLSQLVLEDSDQMVSGIREALSWSLAELASGSSRSDAAPNLLNGQPYNAVGSLPPLKSVCTVEELERSLRSQHRPQGAGEGEQSSGGALDHMMEILQQSGAGPAQGKQQTSFFQPRFPPVILQRPPGLQAPVPLPFAPQAQHLINQQQQQKQQTQHQLLNQQQQMNQQQINQLNQQQAQQQHQLMNQQQPQQMQQQLNQQSHNQLNQLMNPPQQQTQQQQMNQLNQQQKQQLNQLNQQQQMNQMSQQQQQQQLNQLNQQLGQQTHQLMNQQQMMGGMMHAGPQMMMGPRMMGPPPGIGGAPRQQFHPGIGGPGGPGGPYGPQQGSGPFQPFGMPMNMPPQQVMHGNHQPQSLQSIEQNMVGQQKQQQQQQHIQNQQKQQQQMGPMMNQQQQQQPQMQMNHQPQLMHQQQQQPQLQMNHQQQSNQQKSQLNDGGKSNRAMNSMNVYPNKQHLSSQNLVQMIQNTHPMLQNNHGHFNSGYHNASHHPVLNRGGYFNGGNGNNGLFHNGSLIFQNQNQAQQLRNNGDYGVVSDGRTVNGQGERWKTLEGLNGGAVKEGGDPEDEYAGLMSNREKQWLINIQMLQLNTGTPYIDDFYYTVFLDRQSKKEKEGVKEAHKANQQNHPFYSSGKPEGPVHRDRHNSGRHNSTGDESGQAPRTYVPTQFENSLGKLQCGSVTAPRKIIDVELVQSTEGTTGTTTTTGATSSNSAPGRERRALSDGAASVAGATGTSTGIGDGIKLASDQVPREVRRTKQLLLDIEALYCILLRLEEMNDPLAIANAVILKEREEKQKQAEQAHQPPSEESGARIGLPPASAGGAGSAPSAARNLLDENRDELTAKLMAGLLHEDRLTAFMGVRKGKTLIQRVLARVPATHARLREVWPRILRGLAAHARRDSREDRLLATYHGAFRRYVQQSSGWRPLSELCAALEEGFREGVVGTRPASRATPTQHRCPLHLALATPLTLGCISTMFVKSDELVRTSEAGEPGAAVWASFVRGLTRSLRSAPPAAPPIQPLSPGFLTAHLAALAEITGRDEVVTRSDVVADVLVRFLC